MQETIPSRCHQGTRDYPTCKHLLWTHHLPGTESPPFLESVRKQSHFVMWASTFPRTTAMLAFLGINSSSNKPISHSKRQSTSCPLEPKPRPSTLSSCRHCLGKAARHPYCFTTDSNSAIWVPKVFGNLVMAKTRWNWVHCKQLVEQNSMLKPGMEKHTYNLSTWGGSRGRRTTTNLRPDLSI